jgi:GNAT superfamily N-acetyltransferase
LTGHRGGGLQNLIRSDIVESAQMLTRAFDGDPLMQALFSGTSIDGDEARFELFRFSCAVRVELEWPLIGLIEGSRICGVACVSLPGKPQWPLTLIEEHDHFKRRLGAGPAGKYEAYSEIVESQRPQKPHHFLAVLGVDPRDQGRGFGRQLIEHVHQLAKEHPTSTGVALDTENPENISFYERMGYHCTAESDFYGTKIWHYFRADIAVVDEAGQ